MSVKVFQNIIIIILFSDMKSTVFLHSSNLLKQNTRAMLLRLVLIKNKNQLKIVTYRY